jgi:glycosyltransferase A (GT-A) superfamily protein (DUF2064 family)
MSRRVVLGLTFATAWHMLELSEGEIEMTKWTEDNTEGFTEAELDELNAAQAELELLTDWDEQNISDLLNDAWVPGATAESLVAAVREMGLV